VKLKLIIRFGYESSEEQKGSLEIKELSGKDPRDHGSFVKDLW
jgi:hypothetical protein